MFVAPLLMLASSLIISFNGNQSYNSFNIILTSTSPSMTFEMNPSKGEIFYFATITDTDIDGDITFRIDISKDRSEEIKAFDTFILSSLSLSTETPNSLIDQKGFYNFDITVTMTGGYADSELVYMTVYISAND